jgi:hypothetical protein
MTIAFRSVFCILLGVLALESLIANLLVIVVLYRSWSIFKDASYARFPPSVKESIGQEPPYIRAFSKVYDY